MCALDFRNVQASVTRQVKSTPVLVVSCLKAHNGHIHMTCRFAQGIDHHVIYQIPKGFGQITCN